MAPTVVPKTAAGTRRTNLPTGYLYISLFSIFLATAADAQPLVSGRDSVAKHTVIPHRPIQTTPTIGPHDAPVTCDIFFDIQQYGSRLVYQRARALAKQHPKRLRVRFHVLSYRSSSSWLAHAALEAFEQDRFHQFLAALFKHRRRNIRALPDLANLAGVSIQSINEAISTKRHHNTLARNRQAFHRQFGPGVSFYRAQVVVNGKVPSRTSYRLTPWEWETLYDTAYAGAKQLLAKGTRPSELYCNMLQQAASSHPRPKPRSGATDGPKTAQSSAPASSRLLALPAKTRPSKHPQSRITLICNFNSWRCQRMNAFVDDMRKLFSEQIEFGFLSYWASEKRPPLAAHEALSCADEQGAFWPYYDATFVDIRRLGRSRAIEISHLKTRAKQIGIDQEAFVSCLTSGRFARKVTNSRAALGTLGVTAVPAFIVGGRIYTGTKTRQELFELLREQLRPGILASQTHCEPSPP